MIKIKTIQFKRGNKDRLEEVLVGSKRPLQGEPIYELDTNKFKIGDGKKDYKDLPYLGGNGGSTLKNVELDYENAKIKFLFDDPEIAPVICDISAIKTDINTKQDVLISGENIKTINGHNLLDSEGGDIEIHETDEGCKLYMDYNAYAYKKESMERFSKMFVSRY